MIKVVPNKIFLGKTEPFLPWTYAPLSVSHIYYSLKHGVPVQL